jgi:uncharacterized protein YjbI with pentapeptide repeats
MVGFGKGTKTTTNRIERIKRMKKNNQIISCSDFLKLLKRSKGKVNDPTMIIQGDFLTISGKDFELEVISFDLLTFTGMVTISDFKKKSVIISLDSSNFLGGLVIEQNTGSHISVTSTKTKWLHLWQCRFENAHLTGIEAECIDISGLELSEGLTLDKCNFSKLELIHSSTEGTIKTPRVKTNDPIVAEQFRLIGVPVFMFTEAVRNMMESKAEGRCAAA